MHKTTSTTDHPPDALPLDGLSLLQRHMYREIVRATMESGGITPSMRDLMEPCGIHSTSIVSYHLGRLEDAGLISREDRKSRGIRVIGGTWNPPAALALVGAGVGA